MTTIRITEDDGERFAVTAASMDFSQVNLEGLTNFLGVVERHVGYYHGCLDTYQTLTGDRNYVLDPDSEVCKGALIELRSRIYREIIDRFND